jgi:DNA processing protein
MTWEDHDYPARLRDIDSAYPVLYLRGSIKREDEWAVAIVGTRRISSYGRQITERIAQKLANNGVTVESGPALGVGTMAHRAALDAGGRTLAVLGSGVDHIYPAQNCTLANKIIESGTLLPDYALCTPPEASNFPPRNRIISGLSFATVVVEAGIKSGALITANSALDQGREVFAVLSNVFAPESRGPNRFIQNGAHPLLDSVKILYALDLTHVVEHREVQVLLPSNIAEAQLFEFLGHEPLHVDEVRAQTDLPVDQRAVILPLMELKGMVRQVGGMRYTAIRESENSYHVDQDDYKEDSDD